MQRGRKLASRVTVSFLGFSVTVLVVVSTKLLPQFPKTR